MIIQKSLRRGRAVAFTIVGLIAGAGVGAAVGPALASDHPTVTPATTQVAPRFAKNAAGQTYGSAAKATSPDNEPQLIQAAATNGQTGYIRKSELDAANGSNVSSPAEAIKWEQESQTPRSIPVYAQDGVTKIGVFTVGNTAGSAAPNPTVTTSK
jgi:hypothetical protein